MRNGTYGWITGTCDYLWGYVPHVDITFVLTEAVCCFPTERQPAHVPKNRKETKRKNLTDRNSYSLIRFHRAEVQNHALLWEQHFTGHLNRRHCRSTPSATRTRPTMCRTLAGEMNNSTALFLRSRKLKRLIGEIINYKAPIIYSKSGITGS